MPATAARPANRVAPFLGYDQPPAPAPQVPAGPQAKLEALSDTVFAALLALRNQLTHADPKIVQTAAVTVLQFEMTRVRHGGRVVGTTLPEQVSPLGPAADLDEVRYPPPADARGKQYPLPRPIRRAVDELRAELQRAADARGLGEVVSWSHARSVYLAAQPERSPADPTAKTPPPNPLFLGVT